MSTASRLFLAGVVVLAVIAFVRAAAAQNPPRPPHLAATDHVQIKARAAKGDDPVAVRALVDEIFKRSLFAKAAPSLRDRVYRAEIAFRRGSHGPILEQDLIEATNTHVTRFGAPAFARTTHAQIGLFRDFLRRLVPDLGLARGSRGHLNPQMAPAEAVFVAIHLAAQKLNNPEYQIDADEWAKRIKQRQSDPSKRIRGRPPRLIAYQESPEMSALYWAIDNDPPDEASDIVAGAHMFLDRVGLQR